MADVAPDTLKTGDVLTIEASVRWLHLPSDDDIAVGLGEGRTFYVPRAAIIGVRPVIRPDDLVEHALSGHEGLVRHVHNGLAWVAWSGRDENTVVPTADLVRRRTALEMAAVAEPAPLPAAPASVGPYVAPEGDTA